MKVLVTGGAGYIGSHTVVELLANGHEAVIVDNFCNSSPLVLERLKQITGQDVPYHDLDVRDGDALRAIIADGNFNAVIHFAALKSVGESVREPLRYFDNNVGGSVALMQAVAGSTITKFIFSSSACVYGDQPVPYREDTLRQPTNPYGDSKLATEIAMADQAVADAKVAMISLRYFNPVGAHSSGLIGEDPNGVPNNLLPYVAQVASGKLSKLSIFGNDYATPDGTGVRDYIHVVDLAVGHVAALEHGPTNGFKAYNLGGGHGESVLDVVHAFETASGKEIPYEFVARRPGDLSEYYADPSLAAAELDWRAERDLATACRDTWSWQSQNPNGYTG